MKKTKHIIYFLFLLVIAACEKDYINSDNNIQIAAPSEVSASFNITNDNSGNVNITPKSNGGLMHIISFNDGNSVIDTLDLGESMMHSFAEGNYDISVKAVGYNDLATTNQVPLVVSFRAPENLVVEILNDEAISRQVNVTASADYATNYDVYFGDSTEPVRVNANEVASFVFAEAGTTTIRVVANSGGSATTVFENTSFEVTAIMQPLTAAPRQQTRVASDYISIYAGAYDNESSVNTFPDWGQGGQGSSWTTFDLNGDTMLQYTNLSYQGIDFGGSYDVSGMEYVHLDVWTADVNRIQTFLISQGSGEQAVWTDLTADQWTSIDIPISAFTDQGLDVTDIFQFKFVGDPWAAGTVFIDNVYFYRAPSGVITDDIETFEGATPPALTSFGNASAQVVANPDQTGANTSGNVVQFTKASGAEVWAGAFFDASAPLDFTNFSKISVKTLSPKVGDTVRLKVENSNDTNMFFEADMTTSVANSWETLTWDFSAIAPGTYNRVVIFFDFGNSGDGSVYYYDHFQLVDDSGAPPTSVVQDLEGTAPALTSFGNASAEVVANPDQSGINTSGNVIRMTKASGAEVWAGAFFDSSPLDFTNFSNISVKTWSPKVGATVRLKVENSADPNMFFEGDATTSVANSWETLTWDFSAIAPGTYDRVVLFFDFGNNGDGSVYYYDDITLVGTAASALTSVQDFEGTAPAFTAFGNASAQVIANPDATGDNTTANVVELTKATGAEVWAGAFFDATSPLDFDNHSQVSIKTWSPKVGATVRLKVENSADSNMFFEADATTTVANSWETLTWDFSAIAPGTYDRVVLFFDFGNAGDGSVYYYDEINLTN